MSAIETIKRPVDKEMKKFEDFFKSSMKTKVPLLSIITNYILRRKGKQMRPMFVFLSSKLNGGVTDSSYVAAALIELLHTATLIHDDVVDEAYERRGFFSINALWKSKVAVLVGDFLLSKGLLLAVENDEYELLKIVSEAVKEMSEGELLQIQKSRKLNITEEDYFEIIRKKTATLIAACVASGAKSAGSSKEIVKRMWQLGEYIGIAFQLKDDLFDYQKKGIIGKPTGNDLKEKKLTLPFIHVLENIPKPEKKKLLSIVKRHNNNTRKMREIVEFVELNGGLEYTKGKMQEYKNKALEILNDFSESDAKIALREMVEYTISRNK